MNKEVSWVRGRAASYLSHKEDWVKLLFHLWVLLCLLPATHPRHASQLHRWHPPKGGQDTGVGRSSSA